MTDAEIIAAFMEPKPERIPKKGKPDYGCGISKETWWIYALPGQWEPRDFSLDAVREVEGRLKIEQWKPYIEQLIIWKSVPNIYVEQLWFLAHATVEKKIKALAAVLRPEVDR